MSNRRIHFEVIAESPEKIERLEEMFKNFFLQEPEFRRYMIIFEPGKTKNTKDKSRCDCVEAHYHILLETIVSMKLTEVKEKLPDACKCRLVRGIDSWFKFFSMRGGEWINTRGQVNHVTPDTARFSTHTEHEKTPSIPSPDMDANTTQQRMERQPSSHKQTSGRIPSILVCLDFFRNCA